MHARDKISKATWTLFEATKDSASTNITNAVRGGQLKIDANQIATLLSLVVASMDEGFHKGHRVFMKTVDAALSDVPAPPALEKAATKKK